MRTPDVTLDSHPNHHTVGKEYMGPHYNFGSGETATRWFCESHDSEGYWMYATDGSGVWHNVSERAIGRSFHEIYEIDGRKFTAPGWTIRPYMKV
jgi:hypothetical protein